MELRITAFKGSPWSTQNTHEAVVEVRGRNANPDALLGAHLVWRTQTGHVVRGKVVRRHGHQAGNKVLARFHRGLPGQALGQRIEVRARQAKAEKRVAARAAAPTHAGGKPAGGRASVAAAKAAAKPKASKPAKAPAKAARKAAKPSK